MAYQKYRSKKKVKEKEYRKAEYVQINIWKWTNIWAKYWLHCNTRSPYQTKKGQILTQFIFRYSSFYSMSIFLKEFLIKNFQRFSLFSNSSISVNIWARKMFFFFKQVRISPEIDWLCYQWAMPAKMRIVPAKLVEF